MKLSPDLQIYSAFKIDPQISNAYVPIRTSEGIFSMALTPSVYGKFRDQFWIDMLPILENSNKIAAIPNDNGVSLQSTQDDYRSIQVFRPPSNRIFEESDMFLSDYDPSYATPPSMVLAEIFLNKQKLSARYTYDLNHIVLLALRAYFSLPLDVHISEIHNAVVKLFQDEKVSGTVTMTFPGATKPHRSSDHENLEITVRLPLERPLPPRVQRWRSAVFDCLNTTPDPQILSAAEDFMSRIYPDYPEVKARAETQRELQKIRFGGENFAERVVKMAMKLEQKG